MKNRPNSFFISLLFFLFFSLIFFVSFVKSHQTKGTFWADETGVVSSSITKLRSIKQIFYDAANTSQPPLDHIIREKLFVPLGESLGIANQYPEFFHRFPALLWWLLPIGYFSFNLKNYSSKNKIVIIFTLSLLVSSEFLRHYLAEARHYSAIPAVFTTMIMLLLSDRIKLSNIKFQFLAISSLFPFLHLISFPFYLLAMAYFFYQIRKEINRYLVIVYVIFITFVLMMYREIKDFSSPWQHPSISNILALDPVKNYIKWTLDWIFSGGIIYPIYKAIPEIIKNNLLIIFMIVSGYLLVKFVMNILEKKSNFINLPNLLLASLVFAWPVTILSTLYFSGMFAGERYSITVMPIVLFMASWFLVASIWKTFSTNKIRVGVCIILIGSSLVVLFAEIFPLNLFSLDTPDNLFVKQNAGLLKNKNAYLILDNGVYSAAFFPLAAIHKIPIKVNYIQCRDGTFQSTGRNSLNEWLREKRNDQVYLYSLRTGFMEPEKIVWQKDGFVLYRLTHVPEAELCQSPNSVGECYIKCIRGQGVSADGRSIKGVAPNLGVYRN